MVPLLNDTWQRDLVNFCCLLQVFKYMYTNYLQLPEDCLKEIFRLRM
jgi:hypothetical protein